MRRGGSGVPQGAGMKRPKRDPEAAAFKAWVRSLCCIVCWLAGSGEWEEFVAEPHFVYGRADVQTSDTEAHHAGDHGYGRKASDWTCIPLCGFEHHREGKDAAHVLGKRFWKTHGIDRDGLIAALQARFREERAA